MRTRIKICGITRPDDGVFAAEAGADAIGLVFHEASPRAVSPHQAAQIIAALPPLVVAVGLFLDAEPQAVREILAVVPLDVLQFHGSEPADYCTSFGRRYMKSVGMAGGDPWAVAAAHPRASALLLDGHAPGAAGGSGESFDWGQALPDSHRIIIAGGLGPDNVAEAVRKTRPWGVDCSSAVESAPGIKDDHQVAAFTEEVYRVQRHTGH
ncbi:phosphoribosylanthranilate isomerase [Spiribacter salinus M19-40]|uniref:N-(5'-phosphoribosyl)anthranilate isomerase n=2 Tax=Spiribacter salinus TaxID=1335746 RepID=R4VGP0_9GAMM|nr:phosphoribosylanthranilate isomerase [Spiribacter salinus]AGM41386.1 phosphoribosylanthranilate isomerase [Spiribacter salinus M19-40]TQF00738.1 MAG: phosphoribosylanthranilate isomerase [Spiribacter salinus]